jgi:hypothetical protein
MAREVAEALQHTACERAKRVPIGVLSLQPVGSLRSELGALRLATGLPHITKIPGPEDPGYSTALAMMWKLL